MLQNSHIDKLEVDYLYHLSINTKSHDMKSLFGDVKFVCIGGTSDRMLQFASYINDLLKLNEELINLSEKSHRYAMYKVGPVLSVSHGVGIPSMTIVLQELFKLLHYAGCIQPIIIRIGTSGGLNIKPGTVVISKFGINGLMDEYYELPILGKLVRFPVKLDEEIGNELLCMKCNDDRFDVIRGGTMAADDFYRGQGRLDGPFCNYTEKDKYNFLSALHSRGVRNIEMEVTAFGALTHEAGLRAADVCVTLVDRMKGDQVTSSKEHILEIQKYPMIIVGRYIKKYYNSCN